MKYNDYDCLPMPEDVPETSETKEIMEQTDWKATVLKIANNELFHLMVISIIYLIVVLWVVEKNLWGDVDHYRANANEIFYGMVPYSDFMFEYPPLAIVLFMIPRIISANMGAFHYIFAFMAYLAVIVCYKYGCKIVEGHNIKPFYIFLMFAMMIVFANYFIVCRFDIFPAALILISFYYFKKEKYDVSFIMIAIATMVKLYPIILIPLMLCIFLRRRNYAEGLRYLILSSLICILCELPFLINDPGTAFAYLTYHSDRGIQVESIIANVLEFYGLMHPGEIGWEFVYGADHLTGDLPNMIAPYVNPATIIIVGISLILMMIRIRKTDESRIVGAIGIGCTLIVMIFVGFNKVYSAQYMIWIYSMIPMVLIAFTEPKDRKIIYVMSLLFIIASGLMTMIFLVFENRWVMETFIYIQAVKNVAHIALMCLLMYYFIQITKNKKDRKRSANVN